MTAARHIEKTRAGKTVRSPGTRLPWSEVLRAVQDTAERSGLVRSLEDAGFSVDQFGPLNIPRILVCAWLSRYEDRLEPIRGSLAIEERMRCRAVRRKLELELFP